MSLQLALETCGVLLLFLCSHRSSSVHKKAGQLLQTRKRWQHPVIKWWFFKITMEVHAFGETLLQADTFATLPSSCLEAVPACSSFATMIFLRPSRQLETPHNFLHKIHKKNEQPSFCINVNHQTVPGSYRILCV